MQGTDWIIVAVIVIVLFARSRSRLLSIELDQFFLLLMNLFT